MFPDRTMPDAYERTLREIFPDGAARQLHLARRRRVGERWVWTTFNSFQWDLNYANPAVFRAMAEEMLFLANPGVEFLRLDAVAFIWKQLGTSCENLPEAHLLIQAFNAWRASPPPPCCSSPRRSSTPTTCTSYISPGECQISYNPLLMALLWEALATREVKLLRASMQPRFKLPPRTAPGSTTCAARRHRLDLRRRGRRASWASTATTTAGSSMLLHRALPGLASRAACRSRRTPSTGDCAHLGHAGFAGRAGAGAGRGRREEIDLAMRRILLLHS